MGSSEIPVFRSEDHILKFAIAKEQLSHDFYMNLAEQMDQQPLREALAALADEELTHKAKLELEQMKAGRAVVDPEPVTERQDVAAESALAAWAAGDYPDVFRLAIQKEREAFRLYVDLAEIVGDEELRETLISLAEEEAKHTAFFEMERDKSNRNQP